MEDLPYLCLLKIGKAIVKSTHDPLERFIIATHVALTCTSLLEHVAMLIYDSIDPGCVEVLRHDVSWRRQRIDRAASHPVVEKMPYVHDVRKLRELCRSVSCSAVGDKGELYERYERRVQELTGTRSDHASSLERLRSREFFCPVRSLVRTRLLARKREAAAGCSCFILFDMAHHIGLEAGASSIDVFEILDKMKDSLTCIDYNSHYVQGYWKLDVVDEIIARFGSGRTTVRNLPPLMGLHPAHEYKLDRRIEAFNEHMFVKNSRGQFVRVDEFVKK